MPIQAPTVTSVIKEKFASEGVNLFSCSTQLSMNSIVPTTIKIVRLKGSFILKSSEAFYLSFSLRLKFQRIVA